MSTSFQLFSPRLQTRVKVGVLLCSAAWVLTAQAHTPRVMPEGQLAVADAEGTEPLALDEGKGMLLRLTQNAASVFVVDPTIADVHVPSPKSIFVLGKKAGSTTLYVMDAGNHTLVKRTVVVAPDVDGAQEMLKSRFPNLNLQLTSTNGSITIAGSVPDATVADTIVQALTPLLQNKDIKGALINRLVVTAPQQVELRVKITEVDRNVTQELGINWQSLSNSVGNFVGGIYSGRQIYDYTQTITSAAGKSSYAVNLPTNNAYSILGGFTAGGTDIEAVVDALNQEGLITVLAEPNLVALSGQTASFLSGGEYPIPVSETNGAVSVEFKQFGVKLDFTPTVLSDHRISLKVRPEVSQIDTSVSVTTNGITVPGLSIRRADTTVELGSGQSFAIAGLLLSDTSDTVSQVPGLGSIPIIGKLFTSTNYTNDKTELVITVTPYLVNPVDPKKLRTPIQSLTTPGSDVEYSFSHAPGAPATRPDDARLLGTAGYVY